MSGFSVFNLWHYFIFFRHYTGNRVYLLALLSVLAGLSEGVGITLVIPLFTQIDFIAVKSPPNFEILEQVFQFLQIPLTFVSLATVMLVLFLVKGSLKFTESSLGFFLQSQLTQAVRDQLAGAYARMDYQYYTASPSGYFANLVTLEVERARQAFLKFIQAVSYIVIACPYLTLAFLLHWKATLLVIVLGIFLYLPLSFVMSISRRVSLEVSSTNEKLQSFLVQTLEAFKYLRATSRFTPLQQRLNQTHEILSRLELRMGLGTSLFHALKEPIALVLLISVITWQVYVSEQEILPILAALLLIYRAVVAFTHFQYEWQIFMRSVGGVEVIAEALKNVQTHQEPDGEQTMIALKEQIELAGVSFHFGEHPILNNIQIRIPAKKTIAFVGESGSGKSTLVDVITGILRPTAGQITLDGVPYSQINLWRWRERIGYVTQEIVTFDESIANNISLWANEENPELLEKVKHSAKAALAAPFIEQMPETYESIVGDRGVKLSGGQRQRLAIARELFKQPEILILDEATSALDSDSERYIQQSIEHLKGQMTILVIAHRLSTIRNADTIYVLHQGAVIEQGTFAELTQIENSHFNRMCQAQNL